MSVFKESKKYRKLPLRQASEGFISGFFLAILLYCTMLVTGIVTNDMHRIESMVYMKEYREVLMMETSVLNEVKCALEANEPFEGNQERTWESYVVTRQDNTLLISMYGTYDRTLILYLDEETEHIMDWKITE